METATYLYKCRCCGCHFRGLSRDAVSARIREVFLLTANYHSLNIGMPPGQMITPTLTHKCDNDKDYHGIGDITGFVIERTEQE